MDENIREHLTDGVDRWSWKDIKNNIFAILSTGMMVLTGMVILSGFITYYYYLIVFLEEISLQRVLNECNSSGFWMCPILTSILLLFNFLCYFELPVYNTDYKGNYELFKIIFRYTVGKIIASSIDIILLIWNIYELTTPCSKKFTSKGIFVIYIINIFILTILSLVITYVIYILSHHVKNEFYNTNIPPSQIIHDILHI